MKLIQTAFKVNQFPEEIGAEIVMVGRSNVGKSSLINQLSRTAKKLVRKEGARVSQKPGCTQSINFFQFKPNTVLVDLPGFGFAKWPDKVRQNVNQLIDNYLFKRKNIALIVHIIDARLPLQKIDMEMLGLGKKIAHPYLLSLNKCDKLSRSFLSKRVREIQETLNAFQLHPKLVPTSALKGQGVLEIKQLIRQATDDFLNEKTTPII